MKRAIDAVLLAGLLASCASGPGGDARERFYRSLAPRANPSAVIAAELALAREAREKGQWSAFREYAAEDAVMFVPEAVTAQAWLSGRKDPLQPIQWQPHEVWSSCDGSLSVTRGAWQASDGSTGYFTTVWRREDRRRDERYRWVLSQRAPIEEPLAEPDMIRTTVADCTSDDLPASFDSAQADWEANRDAAGDVAGYGESADRTLVYRYGVAPDRAREVTVFLREGDSMTEVLRSEVAAPGAS